MRVLAFEDGYDIEALLTAGGVNTATLTLEQRWNSLDELAHIAAFAPDVMLLDHFMPPHTGRAVLDALLTSDTPRPATVIAMSSEASMNDAMVRAGADLGVVKFDLAALAVWDGHRQA